MPNIARNLLFLALLALNGCSKSWHATTDRQVRTFQQEGGSAGFGGQTVVDSYATNATVVSIDQAGRKLELKLADGRITSYQAGPEISQFNQIKIGDEVKTTLVEELAVSIASAGTTLSSNSTVTVRAPVGGGPGYSVLATTNYVAKITDIDPVAYAVTLQLSNGQTRTLKVRQGINIADFNPGDTVAIKVTEARALLIEKPTTSRP